MEPARDTSSCISSTPAGHDIAEINNVAKAIAADIASKNDDEWEYGAVIYSLNGTIGFTRTVTQQNPDHVDYPLWEVPEGAVILALVHNHPDVQFVNDQIPSNDPRRLDDWDTYEDIEAMNPAQNRGISADPNMLMYVYTNQSNKTHVYDKNDRRTGHESCPL